jgi:hypothetical protein
MWYAAVPAESTIQGNFFSDTLLRNIPSANGDRQMFPKQTIRIRMRKGMILAGSLE